VTLMAGVHFGFPPVTGMASDARLLYLRAALDGPQERHPRATILLLVTIAMVLCSVREQGDRVLNILLLVVIAVALIVSFALGDV